MSETQSIRMPAERVLNRPRVIGRIMRFGLGAFSIWFVTSMFDNFAYFTVSPHFGDDIGFLVGVAIAFWVLPDVVNIGFDVRWKRRSQSLFLTLVAVTIGIDLVLYRNLWGVPLGLAIWTMAVFTHTYLGISHILAAIIGTPGCEMRAIPHLLALARGTSIEGVVCPGHWDSVDKWEAGLGH